MMKMWDLKNRVKFTRKKKCDVCKEVKMVSHECENCYSEGFEKTINNISKNSREDLMKEVLNVLSKYPRRDNFSRGGRLVSADSVIEQELRLLNPDEVRT